MVTSETIYSFFDIFRSEDFKISVFNPCFKSIVNKDDLNERDKYVRIDDIVLRALEIMLFIVVQV